MSSTTAILISLSFWFRGFDAFRAHLNDFLLITVRNALHITRGEGAVFQPHKHGLGRKPMADFSSRHSGSLLLSLFSMQIIELNIWVGEITQNLVPSLWRERKVTFHVGWVLQLLATGAHHTCFPINCPCVSDPHGQYSAERRLRAGARS